MEDRDYGSVSFQLTCPYCGHIVLSYSGILNTRLATVLGGSAMVGLAEHYKELHVGEKISRAAYFPWSQTD